MNKNRLNNWPFFTFHFISITLLLVVFFSISAAASNLKNSEEVLWTTWKESKQVKVSYLTLKNSPLIELKVESTVRSSLSGFLLFIQDTDNMPLWLDNASSSRVLKELSLQENIFVVNFNSFWPVSERYMVINSRHWQNEDLSIEIQAIDSNSQEYLQNDMIKIELIKAHWLIQPSTNGNIHLTYSVIADPKGVIPFWLMKRVSLNSLWKTMNNISEQLPVSTWQTKTLPYIIENTKS